GKGQAADEPEYPGGPHPGGGRPGPRPLHGLELEIPADPPGPERFPAPLRAQGKTGGAGAPRPEALLRRRPPPLRDPRPRDRRGRRGARGVASLCPARRREAGPRRGGGADPDAPAAATAALTAQLA